MSDMQAQKAKVLALESERDRLKADVAQAQTECAIAKRRFKGGKKLADAEYAKADEMYAAAKRRLDRAVMALSELNRIFKAENIRLSDMDFARKQALSRRGYVDEFDLGNQLIEPQTLLRHTVSRLEKVLSRAGRESSDTALIDAVKDYFRRHGISI